MTVARIDHDSEAREWLTERFTAMASEMTTTWDIAQDIAANWTEGRKVSELPECWDAKNNRVKYPGQVFREWLVTVDRNQQAVDTPSVNTASNMLKAARIKQISPSEYQDLPWSLYDRLPSTADAEAIAAIFARAAAQPVGITQRSLRLVQGKASGMKPPYWQQVIEALMTGEHGLTPADARNIIATAQRWLDEQ